jgi:zinc protease
MIKNKTYATLRTSTIRNLALLLFVNLTLFNLPAQSPKTFTGKVPFDPSYRTGKLENGLSYFIRQNKLPEERAFFYLIVNSGAIHETETQNGLAHFCEHMAFNGTRDFPDKGITDYMESIGVSFGGGVNAFTSYIITCYTLNNVPTTKPVYVDTAMMVLQNWAFEVNYTDEEINKERGVIHEEWRTRGGAGRRMRDVTNKVLFNGTPFANHNVIGELSVIDDCPEQLLRDYYKTNYRPDQMAVAITGDIDPAVIEQKIKSLFGSYKKPNTPIKKVGSKIPANKTIQFTSASDKEARTTDISLYIKHPHKKIETWEDQRASLVRSIFSSMLNNRLQEKLNTPDPAFISGYSYYSTMTQETDAYTIRTTALPADPIRSFKAVLMENERVKQHGFTQSELDRAKKSILSRAEKSFNERDKQESRRLASACIGHFGYNMPNAGPEANYYFNQAILPTIKLEEVNGLTDELLSEENRALVVHSPEKEEFKIPTEAELKEAYNEVVSMKLEPYKDNFVERPLLETIPEAGKITNETFNNKFNATEWTLANGIKVVLQPTDNKEDEVMISGFSWGGYNVFDTEKLVMASMIPTSMRTGGISDITSTNLKKLLTGKQFRIYPWLNDDEEGFFGTTSLKDMETALQMIHLYFTDQGEDYSQFSGIVERQKQVLINKQSDPRNTMRDSIQTITNNYHPRKKPRTVEDYNGVDAEETFKMAELRYTQPEHFTFIFLGSIDKDQLKPLVEKYLGSLKPSGKSDDELKNWDVNSPKGVVKRHFKRAMETPKSTVFVRYHGNAEFTPENKQYLNAIRYILRMRFVESVREDEGGSYGGGVWGDIYNLPKVPSRYTMNMQFDCDPEKADHLITVLYNDIHKLVKEGPTAEELQKTKEYFIKNKETNMKQNYFMIENLRGAYKNGYYAISKENYDDIVNNLTVKEIQKKAKSFFNEKQRIEIVMKPE